MKIPACAGMTKAPGSIAHNDGYTATVACSLS